MGEGSHRKRGICARLPVEWMLAANLQGFLRHPH
jgi:hypothetical protein